MTKHRFYDNPERWRSIVGYEGHYKISSLGRVRSCARQVWRKNGKRSCWVKRKGQLISVGCRGGSPYPLVSLSKGGSSKTYTIHSLLLCAFRGPRPTLEHEAMHLDGDSTNSVLENLRWGTISENNLMKRRHGTSCAGETNGNARLSDADEREIRKALAAKEPQRSIARRFGVSQAAISHINVGKIRRWPNAA